ncbi:MAG: calcium-binding protein [Cyanobacteria bacterium P01_C01_bin.72]
MANIDIATNPNDGLLRDLDPNVLNNSEFVGLINSLPESRVRDVNLMEFIKRLDPSVLTDSSFINSLKRINERDDDILTNEQYFTNALELMKDEFLKSQEFANFLDGFDSRNELDALEARGTEFSFLGRLEADFFEFLPGLSSDVLNNDVFNEFINSVDLRAFNDGSFTSFINNSQSSTLTDASFTITLSELDRSILTNGRFTNDLQRISNDFLESNDFYQLIDNVDLSNLASRGDDYVSLPSVGSTPTIPSDPGFITRRGTVGSDSLSMLEDAGPLVIVPLFGYTVSDGVNENYFLGSGDDTADGGVGIDVMFGGNGADQLFGGADSDYLFGNKGDDFLFGGNGSFTDLYSGSDNDLLYGGDGNDVLVGLTSITIRQIDVLTGGRGGDTFRLATISDSPGLRYDGEQIAVIRDFNPDEGDIIELEGDFSNYAIRFDGANTFFQYIENRQFDASPDTFFSEIFDVSLGESFIVRQADFDVLMLENFRFEGSTSEAEQLGWVDYSLS